MRLAYETVKLNFLTSLSFVVSDGDSNYAVLLSQLVSDVIRYVDGMYRYVLFVSYVRVQYRLSLVLDQMLLILVNRVSNHLTVSMDLFHLPILHVDDIVINPDANSYSLSLLDTQDSSAAYHYDYDDDGDDSDAYGTYDDVCLVNRMISIMDLLCELYHQDLALSHFLIVYEILMMLVECILVNWKN